MAGRRKAQKKPERGRNPGASTRQSTEPETPPLDLPLPEPEPGWARLPDFVPDPGLESRFAADWPLSLVLVLSLAVRFAHLAFLQGSPFFTQLVLDARFYDAWAQRLAAGRWIGDAAFWVDPLYAYFLGFFYVIFGHGPLLPRVLNALLGTATVLVVALVARRLWSSRAAAVFGALAVAFFIPAIHYEGQPEKTALSIALIALGLALFLRTGATRDLRAVLSAGLVTGLAVLARGNALIFVPAGALALGLGWERDDLDVGEPLPRPQRMRRAGVFLAASVSVIGLATAHNYAASRELVLTTTNLGVNLYIGNHDGNEYGYYSEPPFLHPDTRTELSNFREEAERRTGRPMGDAELSRYWRDQAWEAVTADPGLAIRRTLHKLQLALNDHDVPDSEDIALVAEWSPVLRSPALRMGGLLPLALLGAAAGWRRRRVRVVVVVAGLYLATLLPFFIMGRLRVQLVVPMAVLAAGAVPWLVQVGRARDRAALTWSVALLLLGGLAAFYQPDWMEQRISSGLAIGWNNLGASFTESGDEQAATQAYERAVATNDASVPAALRTLGDIYLRRREYARAEAHMRRVMELRPDSRSARAALVRLYDTMLQDPRYRDDAEIRQRRADVAGPGAASPAASAGPLQGRALMARVRSLRGEGRNDEAIRVLQEAARTGPYDEGVHYLLGELMGQYASPDAMVAYFSAEVRRDPKPQSSHYFWAQGLARKGDLDGALAHIRQALEIDPAHEMSQYYWGELLERQGRHPEALEHYAEAARIHPEFRSALEAAARLSEQLGRRAEAATLRAQAAAADPNTVRRFYYWARYLQQHRRYGPAMAEVRRMLAERPTDADALRLRDELLGQVGDAAVPEEPSAPAVRPRAPP
jgi:tetratricopeptide (TPR) repeat protein